MQNIPLHLLQAFMTFNESANITEAAQRLQITQPALSKQLRQLEDLLPSPAFTMSGKRKALTVFGRALHEQIRQQLGPLPALIEQTWQLQADSAQVQVTLAARRGLLDRLAPRLSFNGRIFFQELPNNDIVQAVLSRQAEIGLVHHMPDSSELIARPLFKEQFQLVLPKVWFPSAPTWNASLLQKLQKWPCLGYRPQDEILKSVLGLSEAQMSSLAMIRATENYASLAEMLGTQKAWAILPTYLPISNQKNWLLPVPSRVLPPRSFYIIYRTEWAAVPWFKELAGQLGPCFH